MSDHGATGGARAVPGRRADLWVRTPEELAALADALRGATLVAVDTEADSLHHYPGKLCLVQIAFDGGRAHLVDPLAVPDLSPLAPMFADPATVKLFHAADNDLAYFKRLYGFAVASVWDTAVAARCLGATALGLDELVRTYLGVEPGKSRQKDDWSRRPLTAEQETYALDDVLHLPPLRDRLREELRARDREPWHDEECAALAALPVADRAPDPDAYSKLKGTKDLDGRGLAVLREIFRLRERLALEQDRPPFMVLGHEALVLVAARRPRTEEDLLAIPGVTGKVVRRIGAETLEAIRRAEALPESELPVRQRQPRPSVPAAVRRRAEALRAWRTQAAQRLALDPGFLLPQRLIDRLAADVPPSLEALAAVDGMRRWRAALCGTEVLRALAPS
jgi:ribonuclease D